MDSFKSRKLYIFDSNGQFIRQIGVNGRGPGEYITPFFISLNEQKGHISVFDVDQQKIINYDIQDFSFHSEVRTPTHVNKMEYLPGELIAWQVTSVNDYDENILITDLEYNIVSQHDKKKIKSGYQIGANRKLYKYEDDGYFYSPFEATLFKIGNNCLEKRFEFTFGDYKLPPLNFLTKAVDEEGNFIPRLNSSDYIIYYNIFENDNFLCIPFYVQKELYYGYLNKENNTSYCFSRAHVQEELEIPMFSHPIGAFKEYFVTLINPSVLLTKYQEGAILHDELQNIIGSINENENPILLFYKHEIQ